MAAAVAVLAGSALARAADAPPPAAPDAPSPTAPSAPRVWTIDAAAAEGLLSVRGSRPKSYAQVELVLENRSRERMTVDLAGRHLRPTRGDAQRLGLSHPVTTEARADGAAPGTWPVVLAAGESRTFTMNSCCMDAGKRCPRESDEYALPTTATPPVVEAALRWWVDHPTAPQGVVNSAIWQGNLAVLDRVDLSGSRDSGTFPRGRSARAHGGVVYLLDDGALTSIDREGIRRFHATGIWSVWPSADGLLAVGTGASGPELWRFGETGDPPWSRLVSLRSHGVDAVVGGARGATVVLDRRDRPRPVAYRAPSTSDLAAVTLRSRSAAEVEHVDVAEAGDPTRLLVIVRRKGSAGQGAFTTAPSHDRAPTVEIHDVLLRDGSATLRKTFWNVREVAAGPAGAFAISAGRRLERLEGERWVDLPFDDEWVDVVAVGAARVVVEATGGGLASVDAKTGRPLPLPASATGAGASLSVDRKTDQVIWVDGQVVRRWTPGAASVEEISFR